MYPRARAVSYTQLTLSLPIQEAHRSREGMLLDSNRKASQEALTRLPVSAELLAEFLGSPWGRILGATVLTKTTLTNCHNEM